MNSISNFHSYNFENLFFFNDILSLEHILTHISFSVVSIVISIRLIILLINESTGLYDSLEKGIKTNFVWPYPPMPSITSQAPSSKSLPTIKQ
jgi:hypothetical protein